MTDLEAIRVIEEDESADKETQITAWQQLVNSGTVWHLQGSYQRTAIRLLDTGIINESIPAYYP